MRKLLNGLLATLIAATAFSVMPVAAKQPQQDDPTSVCTSYKVDYPPLHGIKSEGYVLDVGSPNERIALHAYHPGSLEVTYVFTKMITIDKFIVAYGNMQYFPASCDYKTMDEIVQEELQYAEARNSDGDKHHSGLVCTVDEYGYHKVAGEGDCAPYLGNGKFGSADDIATAASGGCVQTGEKQIYGTHDAWNPKGWPAKSFSGWATAEVWQKGVGYITVIPINQTLTVSSQGGGVFSYKGDGCTVDYLKAEIEKSYAESDKKFTFVNADKLGKLK